MSDTALFASALTALIDGTQGGVWAHNRDGPGAAEWRWDAAARTWEQRQPVLDELAQCRALLLAVTDADVPHTPRRIKAPMTKTVADAVERSGAVLAPDNTWVARDGNPFDSVFDGCPDIATSTDEELPLRRGAALAPGRALVRSFRAAQDHHDTDMHQWFTRPDGNGGHPDTEDDILSQLLKLADQQTQRLLLLPSTTS